MSRHARWPADEDICARQNGESQRNRGDAAPLEWGLSIGALARGVGHHASDERVSRQRSMGAADGRARRGRTRLTHAVAIVLTALAAAAGCGRTESVPVSGDVHVLRNFTLIDGGRAPLPDAAMVIEAGRVSWVGAATDLQAPSGVPARDLGGAFVIPGLINLHAHLGNTVDLTQDRTFHTRESIEKDLRTYASYGVTTVFSMGTDQDAIFEVRDAQRGTRPSMARVYTAGQGLMFEGGYGGLAGVNDPVATSEEAEREVTRQVEKGVDAIKLWLDTELDTMPRMPAEISQAIIDAAHRRNVRVLAHVFYHEDAMRLAAQGIDGFVHGVRDRPIDQALVDQMRERGIWQVAATLSREASMFAYGSTPAFASDPFFTRSVSPVALELIRSPERQRAMTANPNFVRYPAFFETAKVNLKRLVDAGVPFGFGTDAGPPGRFHGYFEHWELELMVEAGLTPQQALAAATRQAAEFLGARDLGRLDPGAWADLVVLERNPLEDIRDTQTIRAVYLAGTEVPSINQAN
jgi:imidazolonepropionase-like amidohydrolase